MDFFRQKTQSTLVELSLLTQASILILNLLKSVWKHMARIWEVFFLKN